MRRAGGSPDTVSGILVDSEDDDRAEHQRQQDRQRLTGKGGQPVAHQATSASDRGLVAVERRPS